MRRLTARLTVQTRNDHGVALFAAIAGMVVLSTMIAALVILARNEGLIAQLNKDEAQAAYGAESGANWGRRVLHQRLGVDLANAVAATPRPAMKIALNTTYNSANGATQFIRDYAVSASGPQFASCSPCPDPKYSVVYSDATTKQITDSLQNVLTITCPGTAGCPANMAFTTRVIVSTHPTKPPVITAGGNGARFTYVWRIESSGTAGRARQQWVIHDSSVPRQQDGAFTIALNGEFARYAHFIDQFQDAGGGNPWMSYRHVYTGPVHTNRRFSILGNTSTPTEEGPAFQSEATQTMTTTRFSNGGNEQNLSRDSSPRDWPRLGPYPGVPCKQVDCSGFTRGFDGDRTTPGINPIAFPSTSTLGTAEDARKWEICVALGYTGPANGRPVCPATATAGTMPRATSRDPNCDQIPVIVDGNCTHATGQPLLGGIYIWPGSTGALLPSGGGGIPYVTSIQLANTAVGQTIVIYTYTGTGTNPNRRVIIEENRATYKTIVTRQCLKTGTERNDSTGTCSTTATGGTPEWWLDTSSTANIGAIKINQQEFAGVFSRNVGDGLTPTVTQPLDYAVVYVFNADIGQEGTLNGLRRGTFSTTSIAVPNCTPQIHGIGATPGTKDCHATGRVDPAHAIYQDTTNVNNGTRLLVAADGNIWITGALNYRVDPRGPDDVFSDPIPGDASGTSADDQLDVQNVFGIVSWATPSPWVPASRSGGIRISSAVTDDLDTHGMIFAANLSGQPEPSGQFAFDFPDGSFRGISHVLGGVVQKTMGQFGQASPSRGYERDWVFDERFRYRALSPPAFPLFPNFTAATSLGIDSYTWRLGLFN
jgi:hypothetical protein